VSSLPALPSTLLTRPDPTRPDPTCSLPALPSTWPWLGPRGGLGARSPPAALPCPAAALNVLPQAPRQPLLRCGCCAVAAAPEQQRRRLRRHTAVVEACLQWGGQQRLRLALTMSTAGAGRPPRAPAAAPHTSARCSRVAQLLRPARAGRWLPATHAAVPEPHPPPTHRRRRRRRGAGHCPVAHRPGPGGLGGAAWRLHGGVTAPGGGAGADGVRQVSCTRTLSCCWHGPQHGQIPPPLVCGLASPWRLRRGWE
jgi:hypothetical protein